MEYRRQYKKGAYYFFTVVTEKRQPILIGNIDRLREAFRLCISRYPFEIEAIVILRDHLHTIWKLPEGDDDFSLRWMVIKRKFSSGLVSGELNHSKIQKREKGIWQRRFWEHQIRDEKDYEKYFHYIHYNPVKHGIVKYPSEWDYSSFKKFVKRGVYSSSWCVSAELFDGMDAGE